MTAESAMTAVAGTAFLMARVAASPFMCGIERSSTATSGLQVGIEQEPQRLSNGCVVICEDHSDRFHDHVPVANDPTIIINVGVLAGTPASTTSRWLTDRSFRQVGGPTRPSRPDRPCPNWHFPPSPCRRQRSRCFDPRHSSSQCSQRSSRLRNQILGNSCCLRPSCP